MLLIINVSFQALEHNYFFTVPLPTPVEDMPRPPSEKQPIPASQDIDLEFPLFDILQPIREKLDALKQEIKNT